jgi:hypothetical protein
MGDVDPAFEQQLLHVAVTQREAIGEPDAMADDCAGKAVMFVALGVSGWRRLGTYPGYLSEYLSGSRGFITGVSISRVRKPGQQLDNASRAYFAITAGKRVVKDRIRLWKDGVRDLVRELCCALHTFRVRLTPWQPMVEAGYTQVSWRSYRCSSLYTLARDTTVQRPFAAHGPGAAQR